MSLHHPRPRHDPHAPSFVRPHPVAMLRPRGRAEAAAGNDRAVADAYRRFLRRTQDVAASGTAYPGGIAALIEDRETVTLLLVRLLQRQSAA